MSLRGTVILFCAIVGLPDAGAQEQPASTESTTAPEIRSVTPQQRLDSMRRAEPAPWQRVDRAKREYYVFRNYAPGDLAARIDRPVADPAYRELVAGRAASFRSGSRRLNLAIDRSAIIDVGTARPADVNTVALVDLAKSPDLRAMVRRELAVDEGENYVLPFLSTAMVKAADRRATYRAHDSLIVSVAAKDLSRVSIWRLSDGRWERISDVVAGPRTVRDSRTLLDRLPMQRERVYYGGFAEITTAEATAARSSFDSATSDQLSAMVAKMQALDAARSVAQQTQLSKAADAEKQKAAEEKESAPESFMAYGRTPFCRNHCSAGSCSGCCSTVKAGADAHIGAIAFACHALSDLCPWCHIGCAANTAALLATSMMEFANCSAGCSAPVAQPVSQGNPRHCPVT